jgi:biopolymer transport protein TolQ
MNEIASSPLPGAAMDGSIWGMFLNASIVVKLVMIGLLSSSVWCWAIIVNKTLLIRRARAAMDQFEGVFWSGNSLEELYQSLSTRPTMATASLFVAAMREWKRSFQNAGASFMGLQARIEKVLDVSIAREVEKLEANLLVLATVASAGPFVGLFGTVWGIMSSFVGIAAAKDTSLAVVAPGIAEALAATAYGLAAAIPASIGYTRIGAGFSRAGQKLSHWIEARAVALIIAGQQGGAGR